MITKGKYKILAFPLTGGADVMNVKVIGIFENKKLGRIVRYRYNFPFPITTEVTGEQFENWLVTPV